MKKLLILFLALVIVGGLAFGGPINITLSATSTLKWRLVGQVLDVSSFGQVAKFLSDVTTGQTSNALTSDAAARTADSSTADYELAPSSLLLTLDAQDANKVSIVKAQSKISLTASNVAGGSGGYLHFGDDWYSDVFQYIEFPNVIPGVLGIKFNKSDNLYSAYTTLWSNIAKPHVIATIVPMKDASVAVGLMVKPITLLEKYDADTTSPTTFTNTTEIGMAYDFAAAVDASYKLMLNDKDKVTVGLGFIVDTSWGNGVITEKKVPVVNQAFYQESYGAYVAGDPADDPANKWGWAGMPFGLNVGLTMGALTGTLEAQARLVQGKDQLNLDDSLDPIAYEMPLYAGVTVAYALPVGDMKITPSFTFKYSSDFWKWWYNKDYTVQAYQYYGWVKGADIVGRPMSAVLSVAATGIAKMVDVTLTGTLGLGDGEYSHGSYYDYNDTLAYVQTGAAMTLADAIKAAGDANSDFTAADALAYKFYLKTDVKPMADLLLIRNELYYNHDGLGFIGYGGNTTSGTLYKTYLTRFQDVVTGKYYIKAADKVAADFYGIFTFRTDTYAFKSGNTGTATKIVNYADETVKDQKNAAKTTLGYEIGVECTVTY